MRYVHSRGIIHRNLTPENILLDWDWHVRIANFGRSGFIDESHVFGLDRPVRVPRGDVHYIAPECYDNIDDPANDIFSFGLILYELVVGKPVFSKGLTCEEIAGSLILGRWKLNIPNFVLPETKELISDCLACNYRERLCFSGILDRLEEMRFKIIPRVNSSKLTAFVREIQEWETK
jgi:serine/threonine protein kinase